MLSELKKKAVEAENAFNEFDHTCSEWEGILGCSEALAKVLNLDLSEDCKVFLQNLTDVSRTIDRTYCELESKRDELVLEYALMKVGGNLGDIVDGVDYAGRKISIVIEAAYITSSGDLSLFGTRFLKAGRVGVKKDSMYINGQQWSLRSKVPQSGC